MNRTQRNRSIAWPSLAAVFILGSLGAACGSEAAFSDESERDESGAVVEAGEVGSLRLKVGDCLGAEVIGEVESVPVVPCSESHNSEIFHSFDLVGDVFPGEEATSKLAQEGCVAEFDAFIGLAFAESVWDITLLHPTEQSWNDVNDRQVRCGVSPVSGEATVGSARGVAE
jgi:hypothetical protein